MGRKIRGKKHRGVKDPIKQHKRRMKEILPKINHPPSNPDDQEIPKKLQALMKMKEKLKKGDAKMKVQKRKKKKKSGQHLLSSKDPMWNKETPKFVQQPGENFKQFNHRVNILTQLVIKESQYADRYKVDIERDPATGDIQEVRKQQKNEMEEEMAEDDKRKRKPRSLEEQEAAKWKKKARLMKLKKRTLRKKGKMKKDEDDFEPVKETVKFGEVVHQPPTFTAKPKHSKDTQKKPGKKSLFLNKFLPSEQKVFVKFPGKQDLTKKIKNLPTVERRQIELERTKAVSAYRLVKARQARVNKLTGSQ